MNTIKTRRLAAGFTQKQLAQRLGIVQNTLSQYENDLRKPGLQTAMRMAAALGCSVDDLFPPDENICPYCNGTGILLKGDVDLSYHSVHD